MNILLTKINFLGDAVSFLPTVEGIRRGFPDARITLICSTSTASLFAKSIPGIEIFTVDYAAIRGFSGAATWAARVTARLRGRRFGIAAHSYDEPSFSYLLSFFIRARRRVGFASGIARGAGLLTEAIPFERAKNVVDINFDLVRHLCGDAQASPSRVPVGCDEQDAETVNSMLRQVGIGDRDPFVLLHPFSKLVYKEWGAANYKSLAQTIESRTRLKTLFVVERTGAAQVFPRGISGLTIHELASLCGRARLFIGNNSGPMHVAASVGVPALIMQGPSPPQWNVFWPDVPHAHIAATHLPCVPCESLGYIPGRCGNRTYPRGCMREITPDRVVTEALRLLAQSERSRPSAQ